MAEKAFVMLGVIHRDEEGPALLKSWLDRIRPDVVTLELSRYGVRFRRERGEEYKRRIDRIAERLREKGELCNKENLVSLRLYMDMPYEYDVASRFGAEHEVPVYLIDMDFFSYVKLRAVDDLLSEENIENALTGADRPIVNQEKTMARLYFEKGIKTSSYDREMYIRDRYMSAKIKDLMRHHRDGRFLHVCGWQHLQDPANLYGPFNPTKVFFHDKAFCF